MMFIATFAFLPDSPHFYVSKGKREKAIKALIFLRQTDEDSVMEELREIETSIVLSSYNTTSFFDVFRGLNLSGMSKN
jgi:Sugar (and other) transporter